MSSFSLEEPSSEELRSDMNLASKVARAASATANRSGVRLVYSSHSNWPLSSPRPSTIDIAVLDSSFNPPSRAHLALLLSEPILAAPKRAYDGHLLLFSTQNADKGAGKPGDASLAQRVEMMTHMAKDVERIQIARGNTANVAVGLVDKPLIFAKSTLTRELLQQPTPDEQAEKQVRLHWVVGFDTLYRVFQLKYYASLEDFQQQCIQFFQCERTTLVCARRDPSSYPQLGAPSGTEESASDAEGRARRQEDELLASDNVATWVEQGSVGMLDIDPDQAQLSSTKIRSLLKDDRIDKVAKKQKLGQLVPPSLVEYLVESGVYRD